MPGGTHILANIPSYGTQASVNHCDGQVTVVRQACSHNQTAVDNARESLTAGTTLPADPGGRAPTLPLR